MKRGCIRAAVRKRWMKTARTRKQHSKPCRRWEGSEHLHGFAAVPKIDRGDTAMVRVESGRPRAISDTFSGTPNLCRETVPRQVLGRLNARRLPVRLVRHAINPTFDEDSPVLLPVFRSSSESAPQSQIRVRVVGSLLPCSSLAAEPSLCDGLNCCQVTPHKSLQ